MRKSLAGVLLAAAALTGCGVLLNGGKATTQLSSTPAGAEVFVDGNRVGVAPLMYELKKNVDHKITFKLAGHREETCEISKAINPGIVVLDVLGGLAPVVIDAATGSWYKLDKNFCQVTLQKN